LGIPGKGSFWEPLFSFEMKCKARLEASAGNSAASLSKIRAIDGLMVGEKLH
jgi:hypothetical protein